MSTQQQHIQEFGLQGAQFLSKLRKLSFVRILTLINLFLTILLKIFNQKFL